MIRSYDKPRMKDTGRSSSQKRTTGACSHCGQPLVILKDFHSDGDLAVCQNDNCPKEAQPQVYLKRAHFKSVIEQVEDLAQKITGKKKRLPNIEH